LFLNEPTTGLHPRARRRFWELIRTLAADGTRILLTTHYLEEAEALADRVAVTARGRIVAAGAPSTVGGRDRDIVTVAWLDEGEICEVRTAEVAKPGAPERRNIVGEPNRGYGQLWPSTQSREERS
jgi:ABC-2 type transport system ATP-binding protein